LAGRKIKPNKL